MGAWVLGAERNRRVVSLRSHFVAVRVVCYCFQHLVSVFVVKMKRLFLGVREIHCAIATVKPIHLTVSCVVIVRIVDVSLWPRHRRSLDLGLGCDLSRPCVCVW